MSKLPGIITKAKFIPPSSKKYQGAIDYIDRSEAVKTKHVEQWHSFSDDTALHVRNHSGRISTLFTQEQNYVDEANKKRIKEAFIEARDNKSPMWQTIFSFDNHYLKELGIIQERGQFTLDEAVVREATRTAMSKMKDSMELGDTCEWAAAIHYNTGNIHVHTMMVVKEPAGVLKEMDFYGETQYRGKIPPKTMREVKSTFANTIENREPELIRISYLMRQELTKNIFSTDYSKDFKLMRDLTLLMNQLPKDRRTWKYNAKEIKPFQSQIDNLTHQIIGLNNPGAKSELITLLDEQTKFYLRVYGENSPEGNQGKKYKDNKLKELNSMMGNALLRDLSSLVGRQEWKEKNGFTEEDMERYYAMKHDQFVTKKALGDIKYHLQESHQDFLNKLSYERDEWRKEKQRQYELERGTGRGF